MKTFIFSTLSLVAGFATGYFVSNKVNKKKYEKLADEEVKSVKESLEKYYREKYGTPSEQVIDVTPKEEHLPIIDTDSIDYKALKDESQYNEEKAYNKYTKLYKKPENNVKKEGESEEDSVLKPYVISPEEFGEGDYDVKTLNWYSDGVLADDEYNVIKDITGYIGDEALNSFGVYEDDAVYVRNDKYRIDYEILLDEREYNKVALKGVTTEFPRDDD